MPKDFDFVKKKKTTITPPHLVAPPEHRFSGEPITVTPKNPTENPNRKSRYEWLLWVIVLLVVSLIVFLYYQSVKPSSYHPTMPTARALVASQNKPNTGINQMGISVYDSGAGSDVVQSLESNLKAQNYTVTDLGKSQYDYSETYIWYQSQYATQANAVAQALKGRKIVLKETKISNSFAVLVYLGKE